MEGVSMEMPDFFMEPVFFESRLAPTEPLKGPGHFQSYKKGKAEALC